VIGANNINFGGTATGVPPEVSGIGAALSGASSAAASSTNAATAAEAESQSNQSTTPLAESAMSWLEVFVLGIGEESCDPKDLECLKRQKPSPR
jgi:filamentous hemagglutinin